MFFSVSDQNSSRFFLNDVCCWSGEDSKDAVEPGGETDEEDDERAPARRGVARGGAGAAPAAAPARHHGAPSTEGEDDQPPSLRDRGREQCVLRLLPLQQRQHHQRQPSQPLLLVSHEGN